MFRCDTALLRTACNMPSMATHEIATPLRVHQFLLALALLLLSAGLLKFLFSKRKKKFEKGAYKSESNVPKNYPIVGMLIPFLKNRHRILEWTADVLSSPPSNTVSFRRPGALGGVETANPANVEYVLKTNFENYPKGELFQFYLKDFLGRGIINVDGELWRMQRKVASHEFNTRSLRNFVVETVQWEILHRLLPVLSGACEGGGSIDLQDVLERFAFDNICRVAFGVDPACLLPSLPTSPFAEAFEDAAILSRQRFFSAFPFLWRLKRLLGVGSERRLRLAIGVVNEFAMNIIRSRRRELSEAPGVDEGCGSDRRDLLSRFMSIDSQEYADAEYEDDVLLKDIVVSFMLAGRDTTSSALTWFFWLLSSHPAVEERICREIEGILTKRKESGGEGIGVFGYEELKEMHYVQAALCESMRLYSPVPVDSKMAISDDVLPDGTPVGKGWFVTYHIFAMGRMKNIWGSDCLEFKPERWLKDGVFVAENPFKFAVFQAGPRICLGKEMAFIQMKSIVASVLHRYSLKADKFYRPKYSVSLTMRMQGGLPVSVTERSA